MKINGMMVVDATKPVKLKITSSDVKRGDTKDPSTCAAALACMRQFRARDVRVHIGRTYVRLKNKWVRFHTPNTIRSEIIAFDRGGTFSPGEYQLGAIWPSQRAGKQYSNRTKAARSQTQKRKGKRRHRHVVANIRAHGANR